MKTIEISAEDFKLIKSFLPSFKIAEGITSNKYLVDWNELMPVVKQIVDISLNSDVPNISGKALEMVCEYPITIDIEILCAKCVDFIKWYNENK